VRSVSISLEIAIEEKEILPFLPESFPSITLEKKALGPEAKDLIHPEREIEGKAPELKKRTGKFSVAAIFGISLITMLGLLSGVYLSARSKRHNSSLPPSASDMPIQLEIVTAPAGADIWIDGVLLGLAPQRLLGPHGENVHIKAVHRGKHVERIETLLTSKKILMQISDSPLLKTPSTKNLSIPTPIHVQTGSKESTLGETALKETEAEDGEKGKDKKLSKSSLRRRGRGSLDIVVIPWAKVKINGRYAGQTPKPRIRLKPGSYEVDLVNKELKKQERITVDLKSGERVKIRRNWSD